VRAVLELGGVRDVLTKSIGTQNPINLVKATMEGLESLRKPEDVAKLRGISIREVLGVGPEFGSNGDAASESDSAGAAARPAPVAAKKPTAELATGADPASAPAAEKPAEAPAEAPPPASEPSPPETPVTPAEAPEEGGKGGKPAAADKSEEGSGG